MKLQYHTYEDGCVAVVRSNRRGPCSPSRRIARARWHRSGFIAYKGTGR